MTWAVRLALICIRAYQLLFAPLMGGMCRFEPSCSLYAMEAIETHGVIRGVGLAIRRLGRCHPLATPGFDPVPPRTGTHR
jgi:putative membrane protein insertion efficiency factor